MLSKNAFLFTEMVPAKTLIHSKNIDSIIENNNQNNVLESTIIGSAQMNVMDADIRIMEGNS